KNLDYSKLKSKYGILLDTRFSNCLYNVLPGKQVFTAKIEGKSSHAGTEPEKGISAIEIASSAITKMKLGRIDAETSANVGIIQGGNAVNVVTPEVFVSGEVRSRNATKLKKQMDSMKKALEQAVKSASKEIDGKLVKPKLDFKITDVIASVNIPAGDPFLKRILSAAKSQNIPLALTPHKAPSDASIYFAHGIKIPNLGTGQRNQHTTNEYLDLKDFFQAAEIVLATILMPCAEQKTV
ncbi:MAG TPA: peptidase dimerization domain-containing protein, partial [Elusimicrobiales bacterium]|nr:peptidase dimerization domain-containing protein [Elusimicrobiales bacterium]